MGSALVITNCTSRKRLGAVAATLSGVRPNDSIESLALRWKATLESALPSRYVRDLYIGRSFSDAFKVARLARGDLYVVSAGLGLAHELDEVPGYDLTFADPTNPLAMALCDNNYSASQWWKAINAIGIGKGPLAAIASQRGGSRVLIALPSGYLEMMTEDLLAIPPNARSGLRIFTSTAGAARLPPELRQFVLPYDDRLESIQGSSGTRTDFPQRAMRHFVEVLDALTLSMEDAASQVAMALDGLGPRLIPTRTKLDDPSIAAMLRDHWKEHGGSSTKLLRFLRQGSQIACEQSRFREIWRGVKAEIAAQEATQ